MVEQKTAPVDEPPSPASLKRAKKRLGLKKTLGLIAVFVLTALSVTTIFIPVWLIMPWKAQTEGGLELSYDLRWLSPVFSVVVSLAVLALIIWLWRGRRWWTRAGMIVAALLAIACVWASRFNHFELMFNPIHDARYATTSQADFVPDSDMVMAVNINGDAAAYPIRQLAYYHVVHDVVGGVPVVVTY
jgi:hypothetical protein